MSFEHAAAIADAILFEGYILYPYRATAPKNRFRWTFGVLAPRAWSEATGTEAWWMSTTCLLDGEPRVSGRLRFLVPVRRAVEERTDGGYRAVDRLVHEGRVWLSWEEGEVHEVGFDAEGETTFLVPSAETVEAIGPHRVVRRRRAVQGVIRMERAPSRVQVRIENTTPWDDLAAPREEAVRASLVGAHVLLRAEGGAFLSMLDPPAGAEAAADACEQVGCWPVLAGPPGARDLMLASPIILYDHPMVAPESRGDFFDAAEIDELLVLRTATLTEAEKEEIRATDARAEAILRRVDPLPSDDLGALHGARRALHGGEMVPRSQVRHDPLAAAQAGIDRGDRVRLRPSRARTDAQDWLFAGEVATVEAVLQDLDGAPHLAVTLDADPAAELHRWYGRFHYYRLDEVEPLPAVEP